MKKDLKKAFAFILVLALAIGLMPGAGVFALADTVEVAEAKTHNTSSAAFYLTDGAIWTDKQVSVDDRDEGIFEIKLKAIGQNFKDDSVSPKLDVVFVLDVSASMTQNQSPKLANLKTAAKDATDIFLASGNDNRIAIVKYNTTASEVPINGQSFSNNASDIKGAINNLSASNYTNIQNGFSVAKKLINARADKERTPIIILMSDGEPNRYYNFDTNPDNTGNPISSGANNNLADANTIWNTIKQGMDTHKNQPTGPAISIYTIGFGVTGNVRAEATLAPTEANTTNYRGGADFNHGYWAKYLAVNSTTDLQEIRDTFTKLAKELTTYGPTQKVQATPDYHDVEIQDVIGDGFILVEPLTQPDDGTTVTLSGIDNNILTWTIPGNKLAFREQGESSLELPDDEDMNVYTFKVKIADTVTGTDSEDIYYTNSREEGDNKTTFIVDPRNPAYPGGAAPQNLLNYGWLTLKEKVTPLPGTLKIVKDVTGDAPDPDAYYGFVITFTQEQEPYILSEAELEGVNGPNSIWHGQQPDTNNYYFELQNGGWIEIPLPAGVSYELYEDEANGAEPTYTLPDLDEVYQEEDTVYGTMGDISQTITVLNTFGGGEDPDTDKLTVVKKVEGNKAPAGASFDFIATFSVLQYRTPTALPLQTFDTLPQEPGDEPQGPEVPPQGTEGEQPPGTGEGELVPVTPPTEEEGQDDADLGELGDGLLSAPLEGVINADPDTDADSAGEPDGDGDAEPGDGGTIVPEVPEASGPEGEITEEPAAGEGNEINLRQFAAPMVEEFPTTTQVAFSLTKNGTYEFNLADLYEFFDYLGPIHFEIVETPNPAAVVTVTASGIDAEDIEIAGSSISGIILPGEVPVNRVITYTNDFGDTTGGGGGGGGGGSTTQVVIPPEPIPEAPVPEEIILDDEIPAAPLPKTGGIPAILLFGAGALLAGGGLILRRKENNK